MNSLATPFARVKTNEIIKTDETALTGKYRQALASQTVQQLHNQSNKFSLLDAKKRKRNRSANKKEQSESSSAAMDAGKTVSSTLSKRKRKSWTTLKEIVEKRTR